MPTLVTGANGLLGRALCSVLEHADHQVIRIVRTSTTPWEVSVGDVNEHTQWGEVLGSGVDVVVHLAGQVPADGQATDWKTDLFYQTNALGTRNLANQCAQYGVKRFVFVSTVKVLGEGKHEPYRDADLAVPADSYAISKWEAEQALYEVSARTGLEVVIIRPPLVYGPGVKGNFLSMLGWLSRGIPLPLGAIQNQRTLVGIDNLIDLIITCIDHPAAANQTFLVSDDEDLSTTELLRRMSKALGKSAHLIPVPPSLLQFGAKLLGKQDMAQRLLGDLQVDISHTKNVLDWTPPVSVDEGLRRTAEWYLSKK